jgi:hypothetical protein
LTALSDVYDPSAIADGPPLVVDVDGAEGYYRKLRFGGGFHSMGDAWMARREYERADLLALGW